MSWQVQKGELSASEVLLSVQDEVLIAGFGRRGHAVGDIPGVRFKVRQLISSWSCLCQSMPGCPLCFTC